MHLVQIFLVERTASSTCTWMRKQGTTVWRSYGGRERWASSVHATAVLPGPLDSCLPHTSRPQEHERRTLYRPQITKKAQAMFKPRVPNNPGEGYVADPSSFDRLFKNAEVKKLHLDVLAEKIQRAECTFAPKLVASEARAKSRARSRAASPQRWAQHMAHIHML